jgi:hypothetical protein
MGLSSGRRRGSGRAGKHGDRGGDLGEPLGELGDAGEVGAAELLVERLPEHVGELLGGLGAPREALGRRAVEGRWVGEVSHRRLISAGKDRTGS